MNDGKDGGDVVEESWASSGRFEVSAAGWVSRVKQMWSGRTKTLHVLYRQGSRGDERQSAPPRPGDGAAGTYRRPWEHFP